MLTPLKGTQPGATTGQIITNTSSCNNLVLLLLLLLLLLLQTCAGTAVCTNPKFFDVLKAL
jgi:hypothetical protein